MTPRRCVVAGAGDLAVELRTVPGKLAELRASDVYSSVVTKANELYGDLATRGESVVGRIRRQQASRDLAEQAEVTVRRAKATVSSARATGSRRSRPPTAATKSAGHPHPRLVQAVLACWGGTFEQVAEDSGARLQA